MKKELILGHIRAAIHIIIISFTMYFWSENRSLNNQLERAEIQYNTAKINLAKKDTLLSLYSQANDSLRKLVSSKYTIVMVPKN
jgi:hypothetical protein